MSYSATSNIKLQHSLLAQNKPLHTPNDYLCFYNGSIIKLAFKVD